MQENEDPLAHLGSDAIDLRWTMKDIAAKRSMLTPANPAHLEKLIGLGLVEMRDGEPAVTPRGLSAMWKR